MARTVLALDLGTGGVKSALYDATGACLAERVQNYRTYFPAPGLHEQNLGEWWDAVSASIRALLDAEGVDRAAVGAISISGHSLGCIPLDADDRPLMQRVPIWSDARAGAEAEDFFRRFDYERWYGLTGNGFPAGLYPLFKILWLKANHPGIFARTRSIAGSKDFINLRLCGIHATDPSYASGSGAYDLHARAFSDEILNAAGVDRALFPEIVPSTAILGTVLPEIAAELGLPGDVVVVAGGVDNSCMALGARTFSEGDFYGSMGSSSWLTVSSAKPVLDSRVRPFAFAHVVPGQVISATSIFSSGTSLAFVKEMLMAEDGYEALFEQAASAPFGANGLLFVPTLGGGTSLEGGPEVRGAFVGLDLRHGKADMLRATIEGIALGLRVALDELRRLTDINPAMTIVGGGARSALMRQAMADLLDCAIVKTSIDQQSASLGAAALAMVATGNWADMQPLLGLHRIEQRHEPDPETADRAARMLAAYRAAAEAQRTLAPLLANLRA
ncbi:xylulokinase [Kaistia sp. MMO-174]|uniref:xylulokinase n=1 Tax=Kaistia sp. MMO-174 TaxID=3081256 RepID=UPI00301B2276